MQNFQVRSPDSLTKADKIDGPEAEKADRPKMSVIGADITITGNIEASVDLHIEGRVVGDVRCATLILGESSKISGGIQATRVRVSGTVEGAIETRDLAIEASARVTGEITYGRLRVASGAVIEGTMKCNPPADLGADGKLKIVSAKPEPKMAARPAGAAEAEAPLIVIE
jgi:cytoskeletal protein CcmA (bactofilin family)